MDREKYVDESWKDSVSGEKDKLQDGGGEPCGGHCSCHHEEEGHEHEGAMEVNFINYVSSLAFQALIFLGEIPNPMDESKTETNLPQAKFLIDTLILIREKTKGNLTGEEENLLNASVYELELKFVERLQKEKA